MRAVRAIVFGAAVIVPALAAGCRNRAPGGAGAVDAAVALPPGATPVDVAVTLPPAPPPTATAAPSVAVRLQPVSFAPIAHAADPSVVAIYTVTEQQGMSPFAHATTELGTGFVIDKGGIVVTNNHVVEGADEMVVKLSDEREFQAKVVGTDPATDIAVIRIDAKDLKPLPLGDSDSIDVGDWVVAIGNPYGLAHTVSAGIISAKGRSRDEMKLNQLGYYDFLQTDASINPGNSGGPLLNLSGAVVGINSMIRGGGAQGIGFAIPINMAKQLLPMLLRDGHVTRSGLGIRIMDVRELTSEDRHVLKIADGDKISGAVIEFVSPGGAAAQAGLQPGDILLGFDGQPLERSTQLQWLASVAGVGRVVTLRVQRAGKRFDIKVTLGRLTEGPAAGQR
ncbi:MAG TPA: trypsin-like peptidase domain-containing protein [Polyangiaceae bacterium]|nr:trypsin-like peptidase domain-containing protein [Polyangiaceae bacterium]